MIRTFAKISLMIALFALFGYGAPPQKSAASPAARPEVPGRPPLFFQVEWNVPGAPHALAPHEAAVKNPDLELKIYGPCGQEVDPNKRPWLSGSLRDIDSNPPNLWTGMCTAPIAVTLRDKNNFVDLSGPARVRWTTRAGGFHAVRPVVKLADGTLLVGDHADADPLSTLFNEHEFALLGIRWLRLDPDKAVTTGRYHGPQGEAAWIEHPDLTKVDEVGFADLSPGSGHASPGFINVSTIAVYGTAVKR